MSHSLRILTFPSHIFIIVNCRIEFDNCLFYEAKNTRNKLRINDFSQNIFRKVGVELKFKIVQQKLRYSPFQL